MADSLNHELAQEFMDLLQCEGIRSVSQWKLPNDDVPFDEDEALADFCDQIDSYFELAAQTMSEMGAQKK